MENAWTDRVETYQGVGPSKDILCQTRIGPLKLGVLCSLIDFCCHRQTVTSYGKMNRVKHVCCRHTFVLLYGARPVLSKHENCLGLQTILKDNLRLKRLNFVRNGCKWESHSIPGRALRLRSIRIGDITLSRGSMLK